MQTRNLILGTVLALSTTSACGSTRHLSSDDQRGGRQPIPGPALISAPSLSTAAAEQADAGMPDGACTSVRDCSYATIPDIRATSECACPRCPSEVGAITTAQLDARRKAFRLYCADWAVHNPCPLVPCAQPAKLICEEGRCGTSK